MGASAIYDSIFTAFTACITKKDAIYPFFTAPKKILIKTQKAATHKR